MNNTTPKSKAQEMALNLDYQIDDQIEWEADDYFTRHIFNPEEI